ncbi:MAG: 3-dehydroquinate synthase [Candidatus Izemoplasmatales bacterium]|jgi:3-dehydroquinate synthase|nr:3-dehydroquinate synthase [Candidatus Izemoplasmatales bacterium]MDD4595351.1 3-dehydroquinate synthase [Candidatus Izemoplasmatales bacterium]
MPSFVIKSSQKQYEIVIENGLLNHLESHLDPAVFYIVIADDQIPDLYLNQITNTIPKHLIIRFPAGETNKSMAIFNQIINQLVFHNVPKSACVLAVGGGVTGDLAGFVASVYMRGLPYMHIPTTLLAQIDSSIGGKVAINLAQAKNVIGSFYPPDKVLIDPQTLKTLPPRQLQNGMAEMIKYGMIADDAFFHRLQNEDVFANIESFITASIVIKKHFVEIDEFDKGIRQHLNFGHTFGHALESYYKYQKYLHGEAIAIGMVAAVTDTKIKTDLINCLHKYQLPTNDPALIADLKPFLQHDKKGNAKQMNFITVSKIGHAEIIPSPF